jgi:hypothetical protein
MQCSIVSDWDIKQNTPQNTGTLTSKKRKRRIKVKETTPIDYGIHLYLYEKVQKIYSKLIPAPANSRDIVAEMKQKLTARY